MTFRTLTTVIEFSLLLLILGVAAALILFLWAFALMTTLATTVVA